MGKFTFSENLAFRIIAILYDCAMMITYAIFTVRRYTYGRDSCTTTVREGEPMLKHQLCYIMLGQINTICGMWVGSVDELGNTSAICLLSLQKVYSMRCLFASEFLYAPVILNWRGIMELTNHQPLSWRPIRWRLFKWPIRKQFRLWWSTGS